jgi:hypothetical protein
MSRETRRAQKTEVLSMRMDPRIRFIVEFLARVRGQSISTVVERAIQEVADATLIPDPVTGEGKKWRDYWDVNDGIRFLKLASDANAFPSFEEEAKVEFTRVHWPFFYTDRYYRNYRNGYIEILWPRIDEFMEIWRKTKSTSYFAAGEAMRQALSDAGVAAPDWPQKRVETKPTPVSAATSRTQSIANDLDDEIPF